MQDDLELFKQGRLIDAIASATENVKENQSDIVIRSRLIEYLCVSREIVTLGHGHRRVAVAIAVALVASLRLYSFQSWGCCRQSAGCVGGCPWAAWCVAVVL